jgi:Rod binding domain-containing protein
MDSAVQSTALLATQAPLAAKPQATPMVDKADKASKEYEAVFISQMLGAMFSGIKSDGITGGGEGEEMFRSLMVNEYGKSIAGQGGFGLATQMKAQLLKHQEVADSQ